MATISYTNAKGTHRSTIVPEVEGIDPAAILAGAIKAALADSAPVGAVRLLTTEEAATAFESAKAERKAAKEAVKSNGRRNG